MIATDVELAKLKTRVKLLETWAGDHVENAHGGTTAPAPKAEAELPKVGESVFWIAAGREVVVQAHWKNVVNTETNLPVAGFSCHEQVAFRLADEDKTWRRVKAEPAHPSEPAGGLVEYVSSKSADGTEYGMTSATQWEEQSTVHQHSASGCPMVIVARFYASSWEEAVRMHKAIHGLTDAKPSGEPAPCPDCHGTSTDDGRCVANMGHPCKKPSEPAKCHGCGHTPHYLENCSDCGMAAMVCMQKALTPSSEPAGEVTIEMLNEWLHDLYEQKPNHGFAFCEASKDTLLGVDDVLMFATASVARATEEYKRTIAELRIRLDDATRRGQDHAQWILQMSLFLADDEMCEHHQSYKGHCVDDAIAVVRALRQQRAAVQARVRELEAQVGSLRGELIEIKELGRGTMPPKDARNSDALIATLGLLKHDKEAYALQLDTARTELAQLREQVAVTVDTTAKVAREAVDRLTTDLAAARAELERVTAERGRLERRMGTLDEAIGAVRVRARELSAGVIHRPDKSAMEWIEERLRTAQLATDQPAERVEQDGEGAK